MKENERTYQQWKELAERYFEAQTTDVEEEALARFLATQTLVLCATCHTAVKASTPVIAAAAA